MSPLLVFRLHMCRAGIRLETCSAAITAGAQKIFVKWTDKYRMNEWNGAFVRVLGQSQFQCEDMSACCNGKENNIKWIELPLLLLNPFLFNF